MTKRQKFVISSMVLVLGFLFIQFLDFNYRYYSIASLSLLSLLLTVWAIKDSLGLNATLLSVILPVFFTAAVGLFYFLVPPNIPQFIVTFIILALYSLGIYALFLTANIYTVAAARTIALLRAAHAVGFLLTLLTSFFLFDTLLSFKADFWVNGVFAFVISLALFLQGFWSIDLEHKMRSVILYLSLALALIVGEFASVLSFWPVTVPVGSLALTTVMYVGLGLGQAKLQQRLFVRTVKEYFLVGAVVFLTMYLTAKWGG